MEENNRRMRKNEEMFLSCPPEVENLATPLFLRFWIKTCCWHFWFNSHFGVLCGIFCNITLSHVSFLLILATVFISNPKRLSISFYIHFVT